MEVIVTGAGPQCPGCGETKVQLVRHMKTDQKCSEVFKEKVEFESFDAQLKRFRNRFSKQQKKDKNEEEFLEKKREGERIRKAKRKLENEEEFLEKDRQQQKARKAKKKLENEEEFLATNRQAVKKTKTKQKQENDQDCHGQQVWIDGRMSRLRKTKSRN